MNRQILIVDDDREIRALLQDLFIDSGYRVLQANDGESACVLFSQHCREIDLVTLDLELPGISGVETFHRLKSIHPEIKIVILSGAPRYQDFNPPKVPRVDKPFSADRLLDCIHALVQ
ncbi:MAG: response regulator [Candidatus Aminicenantes bacterium]|nr:response regulator [Candidatus Aminicenantes bacterium]